MRKLLLTILVLALPLTAYAKPVRHAFQDPSAPVTELSAVAMNGAAGTRTFTFSAVGYARTVFYVSFTHANSGTLTLTCTASPDGNTTDHTLTVCNTSAGTCTLVDAGIWVSPSLTGDKDYVIDAGVLGYRDVECVLVHGGSVAAADVVTLKRDTTSK